METVYENTDVLLWNFNIRLVTCAQSHPGQSCFEAAVAQSCRVPMACVETLSEDVLCVFTACLWLLGVSFEQCTPSYFWCGHPAVCPCPAWIQQVPSVQVALHKALGHGDHVFPLFWGSVLSGTGTFLKPSAASSLPQTSTAMGSSATTSCTSCSRRPACLSLGTKWERSSRSSWLMVTRIKMGRLVLKNSSM